MLSKLPRWLLIMLGVVGLVFFAAGQYLEWYHPAWLAGHPITTNMIASVIAFSAASLVVGAGFNFMTDRIAERAAVSRRDEKLKSVITGIFFLVHRARPLLPTRATAGNEESTDLTEELRDALTVREILDSAEKVMNRLGEIPAEPRREYRHLYSTSHRVFHNEVKPYAEEYLVSESFFDRTTLITMEDALREGQLFLSITSDPEANRMCRENLGGFGKLIVGFMEDVVRAGHITDSRGSA